MTGPRILFVVDAGPSVGGGHVMRSLTLARALEAQGARAAFVGPPAVSELLDPFAPDTARIAAEDLAAAAVRESFDAIVFDHYGLSEPDHRAMAQGRPVLVIDDLANRPLGADLVLDSGPARRAEDYNGLTRAHARLLLGPTFAPVRPEFAALRSTLVFYESGPRLSAALGALAEGLGNREAAVAREISKLYEECATGTLADLAARYADAPPKGEIVIVVGPPGEESAGEADSATIDAALRAAMADRPVAQAAKAVAKQYGLDRHDVYARALALKEQA